MNATSESSGADGSWAAYSKADMERRWARARALMADRGLDALLISNEENFQYFTGTTGTLGMHYSVTRPAALILPVVGEPVAVVGELMSHSVKMTSYLSDVRGYANVLSFPTEMVVDAIKGLEGNIARIGTELGQEQRMGMPVGDYMSISDTLGNITLEDAADLIVKMRMVKTPEEVAHMREAADITGRARQRLFQEVAPGMTERDVVRRLRQLMLEEGADRTSFIHVIAGFPVCHTQHHLDRPLEKGSVLYIDAGAYVRYHTIDYARCISLGPASDEDKRAHDTLLEANTRMIDALKPGVSCSELHEIAAAVITGAGYEIIPSGRLGHGQGLQFTEPPSICPEDHTVLEEGMVISTEPEATLNLLWEDVHVITADGHDQLTTESTEFHEVPFG